MEPDNENRAEARRTTLKGGRIVFNGGRSTIDCTIRNLSSKGAKLKVASVVGIPETFELLMQDNTRHGCQVRWRTLNELGVEFDAEA